MRKQFTKLSLITLLGMLGACSSMPMPFGDKSVPVDEPLASSTEVPSEEVATQPYAFAEVPATPVPPLNSGTQALFDRALSLLKEGNLSAAQVLFEEVTLDQPELAGPWVNLGHIYLQQEQTEAAKSAFAEALKANPHNCDALTQMGVLSRREGRFAEAETFYQTCIKAQPLYADAHLNLGILYELYMGRLGEALAAYNDYQLMLSEPDQRVTGWMMDLERRVEAIAKR